MNCGSVAQAKHALATRVLLLQVCSTIFERIRSDPPTNTECSVKVRRSPTDRGKRERDRCKGDHRFQLASALTLATHAELYSISGSNAMALLPGIDVRNLQREASRLTGPRQLGRPRPETQGKQGVQCVPPQPFAAPAHTPRPCMRTTARESPADHACEQPPATENEQRPSWLCPHILHAMHGHAHQTSAVTSLNRAALFMSELTSVRCWTARRVLCRVLVALCSQLGGGRYAAAGDGHTGVHAEYHRRPKCIRMRCLHLLCSAASACARLSKLCGSHGYLCGS